MKSTAKVIFGIIKHEDRRYETVGDYWLNDDTWEFRASRMRPVTYSWLVLAHEFIEWLICRLTGVNMKSIDQFDIDYEGAREDPKRALAPCGCTFGEEPGDDVHAPYHSAHQCATLCEKAIARELGVDWEAYGKAVNAL